MKFVISLFLAFFLLSCSSSTQQSDFNPIDLIPSSSIFIYQSEELANTASVLMSNSFFKDNQNLPIFQQVSTQVDFFNQFETASSGVICFSAIGKKDIASTFIASSEDVDFLQLKNEISNRKTFLYEGKEINEFTWKDQHLYAVWFGENLMVSDSKLIIENKIRDLANAIPVDETFSKILKTVNYSTPSIFLHLEEFKKIYHKAFEEQTYNLFSNLSDWVALDLKIDEAIVQLNGVSISDTSKKQKLSLLKNQKRVAHEVAKLVALNAIGFESYSITNFEAYLEQRKAIGLPNQTEYENVFEEFVEVSKIHFAKEDVAVLRSEKADATFDKLKPLMDSQKNFRGFEIFQLKQTDLLQIYAPLVVLNPARYVTQIADFFVFTASIEALENVIISHMNRLNLHEKESYQTQVAKLSSTSTVLLYALAENWADHMQTKSQVDFASNFKTLSFDEYKGIALQLNVEEEYAYLNLVLKAVKKESNISSVQQKNRFKLETKSLTPPQLFTNWRTKQRDVFVQDQNLDAQLIDANGNRIWSKKLDDIILGQAVEFDIYRNTRLQLAFATENKVYVVDKNGKDVSPFPIQFVEKITQPLQIFDYDNNGNYRFVICHGNTLKAYDKGGSQVKGFAFKTKNSPISRPPKHERIGTKDYILVQEASGILHILDRRGQERVTYSTDVSFSGKPWFVYDGKFTSTTADGDLVQISEKGKVEITAKELLPSHFIVANERLLVTLSENILQINEVQIKMDYGLYTPPQILHAQDKTFVSVVDKQAKKLYVFDEFGKLLNGFPVYGNSKVDCFNTEASKIQIMLEGEEGSILFYEIN